MSLAHLYLAAGDPLQKIESIPHSFWLKIAIVVGGIIAVVIIFRRLLNVNKFVMGGVLFIGVGLIGFNMLYHRTEPKFLTPLFDRIAPFFPSAGAYETKQATTPGK